MTDPREDPDTDERALELALAESDPVLTGRLRELLDPGETVSQRTAADVDRSLRAHNPTVAAADLLGVGWRTLRLLLTDDIDRADRGDEGS
ncbi:MAG: hypothetical protein V9E94_19780 [Microthrixaceae bacterium]